MCKKLILVLVLVLCVGCAMAEGSLMETYADRLAQELPELVGNEAYLSFNTYSSGFRENEPYLAQLEAHRWVQPVRDVYLSFDADAWTAMVNGQGYDVTENMENYLQIYIPNLINSLLNDMNNYEARLASSVAQNSICYVDPAQPNGSMAFIRFFADGTPLLYRVTANDGAVLMSANALLNTEQLEACQNMQEVQAWLDTRAMKMVTVAQEPVLLPNVQNGLSGGTMPERVLSLVQELVRNMADPEFAFLVSSGDEEMAALLKDWSDGDYTKPRLMAQAEVDVSAHGVGLWGINAAHILKDDDGPAVRALRQRLAHSLTAGLIARFTWSADVFVARSIAVLETMYADPQQPDGTGVYFLLYESGDVIEVAWLAENGVVTLDASYFPVAELTDCATAVDLSLWMMQHGLPLQCIEVELD